MAILQDLTGTQKLREAWPKIEANEQALNADIAAEAINRTNAITAEAAIRTGADNALGVRIDNIVAGAGSSNSEIVDARQGYNVLRDKLHAFCVDGVEYGMKGDKVTDNLAAANNALVEAQNRGAIGVWLPPGQYYCSAALTNPNSLPFFGDNAAFLGITETVYQTRRLYDWPNELIVRLVATAQGASYNASYDYTVLNNTADFSTLSSGTYQNTGWLAPWPGTPGNAWLEVALPFGVVIGDSMAEGHPALHGRLDANGTGTYDPNYANSDGQLSYDMGRVTGLYWYNHGIGSQNSAQIWQRWKRDVLAQVYDPGDGRGSQTLTSKPAVVLIVVGINDVFQAVDPEVTKANLVKMAKSARDNGIMAIFLNLPPHNSATSDQLTAIKRLNDWMRQILPAYSANVVDYYTWAEDPANLGHVNPNFFADYVHPNKPGYKGLARYTVQQVKGLPIYLRGLVLESNLDPIGTPVNFARPKEVLITVGSDSYTTVLDNVEHVYTDIRARGETTTARILINSATLVTGNGSYAGFSKIRALLSSWPQAKTSPKMVGSDISARVYNSVAQAITNSTWTQLACDSERYDTDSIHSTSSNTTRLTATTPGKYAIAANAAWTSNSNGVRMARLKINGVTEIAYDSRNAVSGYATAQNLVAEWYLNAGDYVTFEVWQNSGGSLNVLGADTAAYCCELSTAKVG